MKKLRVCHLLNFESEPFIVEVNNINEAQKIIDILTNYDLFQSNTKNKPHCSIMSTVEQWNKKDGEWEFWLDEDTGIDNLKEYFKYLNIK